jgi:hypothetical protein
MRRVLGCGIALTVICGCSTSDTATVTHPGPARPAPITSAEYAAQSRYRTQQAAAYAERLAAATPRVPREQPLTTPPPVNLQNPDETIGVGTLVVRARYWTAPGSADAVYRELKRARTAGLRVSGYGLPSSLAEDRPDRGFVHFDPDHFPSVIQGGELYVEMEALTPGRTIIAAFAEVYPDPVRQADETIPVIGSRVVVMRERRTYPTPEVLGRVSLDAVRSEAFVRAFDLAPPEAPATCIGGLGPTIGYAATITAGGRTWQLTYPGSVSNCGAIGVALGKQQLPDVQPTAALRHLLAVDYMGRS